MFIMQVNPTLPPELGSGNKGIKAGDRHLFLIATSNSLGMDESSQREKKKMYPSATRYCPVFTVTYFILEKKMKTLLLVTHFFLFFFLLQKLHHSKPSC